MDWHKIKSFVHCICIDWTTIVLGAAFNGCVMCVIVCVCLMLIVVWVAVFVKAHVAPTEKWVKGLFFLSVEFYPTLEAVNTNQMCVPQMYPPSPPSCFPPTQYPPFLPCSLFHNLSGDQRLEMERSLILLSVCALTSILVLLVAGESLATAFKCSVGFEMDDFKS